MRAVSSTLDRAYMIGAKVTGPTVFFGIWIYCAVKYGFLVGGGLGWLPAVIGAVIAAAIWPLIAASILIGAGFFAWAVFNA